MILSVGLKCLKLSKKSKETSYHNSMKRKDNEAVRHEEVMEKIKTDPTSVASMIVAWETELSKVFAPDYKDWWQNSKEEWPMIARMTIESLREREQLAWDMLDEELRAQDLEMQRLSMKVLNGRLSEE